MWGKIEPGRSPPTSRGPLHAIKQHRPFASCHLCNETCSDSRARTTGSLRIFLLLIPLGFGCFYPWRSSRFFVAHCCRASKMGSRPPLVLDMSTICHQAGSTFASHPNSQQELVQDLHEPRQPSLHTRLIEDFPVTGTPRLWLLVTVHAFSFLVDRNCSRKRRVRSAILEECL
jgi:hypothetical protein